MKIKNIILFEIFLNCVEEFFTLAYYYYILILYCMDALLFIHELSYKYSCDLFIGTKAEVNEIPQQ